MKRFLAIILSAMLIVGLVPTVFAADAEDETTALEYNFTTDGMSGGNPEYSGFWRMYAGYNYADMSVHFIEAARRIEAGNGITYKINVKDGGMYVPTLSYVGTQYGGVIDVYIVSAADAEKNGWNMAARNNLTDKTNGTERALYDFSANAENSVVKKIIDSHDTYNGKNTSAYNEYNAKYIGSVACEQAIELSAGDYYVIFSVSSKNDSALTFGSYNGSTISISSLTLQKAAEVIDKTHNFLIDTDAMTDSAYSLAEAAYTSTNDSSKGVANGVLRPGTGLQFLNELSEIDSTDSNRWALRYFDPAEDGTASAQDAAALTISARKTTNFASAVVESTYRYGTDHINSRLVLLLEVLYEGTYTLAVTSRNIANGTAADVYMIPEADVLANNNAISRDFIKKYAPVGRIDTEGETTAAKLYEIGTVNLEKNNYYIIFNFNSDTTNSSAKHYFYLQSISLTESTEEDAAVTPDEMTQNELSFSVNANIDGAVIGTDIGEYNQGSVASVERGTTIKLTAGDVEGYEFVGWKRGGVKDDERGIYLDKAADFDYTIMTNTYLTAIYVEENEAEEGETKVIEFWNEYGSFISRNEEADGCIAVPDASLTGHVFDNWYINGTDLLAVADNKVDASVLSHAVTRAIAKYSGTSAVTGYVVGNGSPDDYKAVRNYGDKVETTDTKATCWRRDGKIVAYDTDTYTHYVWDATQIMSSYEPVTKKTPIVVLEDTAIDGARMIEYDRGDASKYEICEVGILFGSKSGMVISSCEYKATSQRNEDHGQFAASPIDDTYACARGYIIYKDLTDGSYRVVYAD